MRISKIFNQIDPIYKSHKFSNINFDSRRCKNGDIFFAIKGKKINGNLFVKHAITNGAKTIISQNKTQGFEKKILYLYNPNPRKLLAESAVKLFKLKPKNLIAVTGTNGKSSIVNFYYQILKLNKKRVASIGTLGIFSNSYFLKSSNTTLDPIKINQILQKIKKNKINNVILEASSHGLKQHRLYGIKFNTGIFTNLSRDHLDYHRSYKDYLKSKMILFKKNLKKNASVIYDREIKESKYLNEIVNKNFFNSLCLGKKNSDFNITNHSYLGNNQLVQFKFKNKRYNFITNLIGKIQIKNLMMAIIAANKSNIPLKKIINCLNKIKSVNGRLEQVGKIKNCSKVVLDYAHTPDALKTSLENLREQFKFSKISIVFGCGGDRDKQKRKIMGLIANNYCDKIYLTDDNPRTENPKKIRSQIKSKIEKNKIIEIPSRKLAIYKSINDLKSGDVLLVAGKGHENYQEFKTKKRFSDKKYILKFINLKNKNLKNNWKLNILEEKLKQKIFKKNENINLASIDSREIKKQDIFFGVKGKNFDGNKFATKALKKGAALSIVEKNYGVLDKNKIKVKNSLKLLTDCSKLVRKTSLIRPIAITGSSGKTSLKELVGQSLGQIASTSFSKKSFNNKYGVPLSLFNINLNHTFGVFEVGMDKKGEIDKLTKIIKPDVGIITNISYAHIKNFKNLKGIANAKSEIINNILENGTIILNKDDKFFNFFKKKAKKKKLKILSFGFKKNSDISFINLEKKNDYFLLKLKVTNINKEFKIKEQLNSYIPNILAACALISCYFPIENIKNDIFYNFKMPQGRGEKLKMKYKNKLINIIDESYNSNPLSLEFAIKNFEKININQKHKNLLLGDMLELGKFSKKLHQNLAKLINKAKFNKLYVIGNEIKTTFNKIKTQKKGRILKNEKEVFELFKNSLKDREYIMVKGSNATGLNKIISKIKNGKLNAL